MTVPATVEQRPTPARPHFRAAIALAVFVYFVLLADLGWRDISPGLTLIGAGLAAGMVAIYLIAAPNRADRFDGTMLIALLIFAIPCVFSKFPRQSFDSLLAGLLYVAGLFLARGVLCGRSARRLFLACLRGLSAFLTVATAAQLIVPFVEWWALTDWTTFPPLDLKVVPWPWLFRYEVALLLLLLYPSWWIGQQSRLRTLTAALVGVLIVAVCLVVGSRTVWVAAAGGAVVLAIPIIRRGFAWNPVRVGIIAAIAGLVILMLLATGLGTTVGERVFRIAPLAERGSMWGPLIEQWSQRPLVGHGPGSFPWLLQLTDYFDTNSLSPRHADSGVVQLIVETGLVGLAAALTVLVAITNAVFKSHSRAARFAIAAFLFAEIGLNPGEFAFLMAVVIGWVAFAVPRRPSSGSPGLDSRARPRPILLAGAAIVGVAFLATVTATLFYTSARRAIDDGDLRTADAALEQASSLDPGMAIYPRQLGTLRLILGDPTAASVLLERAVAMNPSDDLAWRVLAIAYAEDQNETGARVAMQHAIDRQRSDPTNLLLMADMLRAFGDDAAAGTVLAEVVQAWPMIIGAPEWPQLVRPSSTGAILATARSRWLDGLPSAEPLGTQRLFLGVMGRVDDGALDGEPSHLSPTLARAFVAVTRCDTDAGAALAEVQPADRRAATYWALTTRLAEVRGDNSARDRRLHRIMTGERLLSTLERPPLNPLHVNGVRGSNTDVWGYRRQSIQWPTTAWDLPSPNTGFVRWHREPAAVVREAGLGSVLEACLSVRHAAPP